MAFSAPAGDVLLPPDVLQPFPLHFRRDDLHVMAFFQGHPTYEAVEAMIRLGADGRHAIRAILTRHDQSQIDHINDAELLASFQGTERECCRRDIDLQLESLGEARRARLNFARRKTNVSFSTWSPAVDPIPRAADWSTPAAHSAHSSLPLMWRDAEHALADPSNQGHVRRVASPV